MAANQPETIPLVWNEALSGIFGSISLACWIFLLVPQVYENYVTGSAAGLSLAFLVVWFIGDLTNFLGAVLAGLVPTVVALSIWYLVADAALLAQVLYYNHITSAKAAKATDLDGTVDASGTESAIEPDENAPLIRRNSTDVPGSRRRASSLSRRRPSAGGLEDIDENAGNNAIRTAIKNVGAIFAIFAIGTAGWGIAYGVGAWKPTPPPTQNGDLEQSESMAAIILGYASAVAYLGARLPQIYKNYKDQSCEGLSLLFFILSMLGNITYGAQIVFHSVERQYMILNLPWLIGSLGTVGEDLLIFAQFRMYRKQ